MDLTRSIIYILLPLSVVVTMALASQGVVQNLSPGQEVQLVEPIAVDSEGNIIENATIDRNNNVVFVDGEKSKRCDNCYKNNLCQWDLVQARSLLNN